jgi:hypothetical protein
MRPQFTLAKLLLLTVIVAFGAQMFRSHIRVQKLKVEIAVHDAVRVQDDCVRGTKYHEPSAKSEPSRLI